MKPNDTVFVRLNRCTVIRGTIYAVQTTLTEYENRVDYQVQYFNKNNCTMIDTFRDSHVFQKMEDAFGN